MKLVQPPNATEQILFDLEAEKRRRAEAHGGGKPGSGAGAKENDDDEEEGHAEAVDERWLVSYADMMTLLFGLFVMLYSMANRLDEVRGSVSARFKGGESVKENTLSPAQLQAELEKLRAEATTSAVTLKQAQDELEKAKRDVASLIALKSSPMAIVMRWSTFEHDMDLVVEDPDGKTFDFKNRKHAEHPGQFVLDSRQGPGAEVWQAERILKGVYKVHVIFYNPYGNPEPAKISLSVLTSKGTVDVPEFKMKFVGSKRMTYRFSAGPDGAVNWLH